MAMPAISATGDHVIPAALRSRGKGFTLVELLVALAIMVLLVASVPIALNRMVPGRRVVATADQLIADIRWLQGESLRTGQRTRLAVQANGYSLEVSGSTVKAVRVAATMALNLRGRGEQRAMSQLVMFPDGTASPGRLDIVDSGRRAAIEISMLTGRARLLR